MVWDRDGRGIELLGVLWRNLPKCESGFLGAFFFEVGSVGSLSVAASLESAGIPRVFLDFLSVG
jgi:hypothetical protein